MGRLRYLTRAQVARKLGVGLTKLAEILRTDPTFPAACGLPGKRCERWLEHEVESWMLLRPRVPPNISNARQDSPGPAKPRKGSPRPASESAQDVDE
jgi:predicted DNA-binding transcriptional regulator AlpA